VQAPLLSHWPVPQHDPGAHVVVPGAPEVLGHVVVTGEAIPLEWLVHIGASDLLRQNPAAQHQPALHCANGFGGRLRGVHPELTRELPPPRLPSAHCLPPRPEAVRRPLSRRACVQGQGAAQRPLPDARRAFDWSQDPERPGQGIGGHKEGLGRTP
jgi:hypothetical protein